jgi:SAM-dependent methyltransferase
MNTERADVERAARRNAVRHAWDVAADAYAASRRADGEDTMLLDDLVDGLPADATVLDLGCGDGARTVANLRSQVGVVGLDFSRRALELARRTVPDDRNSGSDGSGRSDVSDVRGVSDSAAAAEVGTGTGTGGDRHHVRYVQGDMTALPLSDESVDAATAYHAVFHVPRGEHPTVYGEVARVLRPGGRFLLTVGRGSGETTQTDWLGSGGSMFWSTPGRETTLDQLRAAGFAIDAEWLVDDPLGSMALFVLAELRD